MFKKNKFLRWQETAEKVLYITIRFARDDYTDNGGNSDAIVEAEAPASATQSPSVFDA